MKVCIYPRISSPRQLESGDSIDAQVHRLKNFCSEQGFEIVKQYVDEGKSASINDDKISVSITEDDMIVKFNLNKRPEFKRMIQDAKKKEFDAIVFYKWDRYSRNAIFSKSSQIYFKSLNIELIPSDDDNDPLIVAIRGALNEEEVRKIKQRVELISQDKFDKGLIVGRCSFGYEYEYKNKKDKKGVTGVKVNKKEAEIVERIFTLTSLGVSYKQICEEFKLSPQSYYNMIRNKVYIGIISFNGSERKGIHSPLISEELFNKCQDKIGKGKV